MKKHTGRAGYLYCIRVMQSNKNGRQLMYLAVPEQGISNDFYADTLDGEQGFIVFPHSFHPPFPGFAKMRKTLELKIRGNPLKITFNTQEGIDRSRKLITTVTGIRFLD